MDKVYSHYIYLSTYFKVMNVHTAGRTNTHDNNLVYIKGPISWLDYAFHLCLVFASRVSLACEAEVASHLQLSIKVLKFKRQVSILTFLRSAQFPMSDKYICQSMNTEINRQKKLSIALRPLKISLISRNQKLIFQNNRSVKNHSRRIIFFYIFKIPINRFTLMRIVKGC